MYLSTIWFFTTNLAFWYLVVYLRQYVFSEVLYATLLIILNIVIYLILLKEMYKTRGYVQLFRKLKQRSYLAKATIIPVIFMLTSFCILSRYRFNPLIGFHTAVSVIMWFFFLQSTMQAAKRIYKHNVVIFLMDTVLIYLFFILSLIIYQNFPDYKSLLVAIVFFLINLIGQGTESLEHVSFWVVSILAMFLLLTLTVWARILDINYMHKEILLATSICFLFFEFSHQKRIGMLDKEQLISIISAFIMMIGIISLM